MIIELGLSGFFFLEKKSYLVSDCCEKKNYTESYILLSSPTLHILQLSNTSYSCCITPPPKPQSIPLVPLTNRF
jgi:hypothetical protein